MPNFRSKIFFQLSLLLIFILGLMFYLNPTPVFISNILSNKILTTNRVRESTSMSSLNSSSSTSMRESMTDMSPRCPNLLRQEGDMIMLYDLNQPGSDTNPAVFYHLAEYAQFVKEQQANGLHCPVLKLQTEPIGASVTDPEGKPPVFEIWEDKGEVSSKEYGTYDPNGEEYIGKFTPEDEPISEEISDNPMDPNWGGVQYSQQTLASGKYDGDMVGKPIYFNMRQNQTYLEPGSPGFENVPPNYLPRDLTGEEIQVQRSRS